MMNESRTQIKQLDTCYLLETLVIFKIRVLQSKNLLVQIPGGESGIQTEHLNY